MFPRSNRVSSSSTEAQRDNQKTASVEKVILVLSECLCETGESILFKAFEWLVESLLRL